MARFELISKLAPKGDQPKAIEALTQGLNAGKKYQTLLGVTGSGKTFTIANVINRVQMPTLIISHNKTLAAQLYSEMKELFPKNAVEYFVSYYDYYQPEAYIPQTDTYIEKDASINEQLDRLRLSATSNLISRNDVIIVSSVSCIYNLGSPEDYREKVILLAKGQSISRDDMLTDLIGIYYSRNDFELKRAHFKVKGDVVEIFPAYTEKVFRIIMQENTIENITEIDSITGKTLNTLEKIAIYPAKHFVTDKDALEKAIQSIMVELESQLEKLKSESKLLEYERLKSRTNYDIEMLRELGYCNGVENYSRHLSGRPAGSRPYCLIDYFPKDFLTIIDESHVTLPQLHGMYEGDHSRKITLVEHGFRLPSALDNRPLRYDEFDKILDKAIYVSATPGVYEMRKTNNIVSEQIIRPTGLIDPEIVVKPTYDQIDDLIAETKKTVKKSQRVLVTTLTKKMAEMLSSYLQKAGIKANYLHSEIDTIERVNILRQLRLREFDCLVGVNLLREGLDLPEVSLVVILDADKEGFLRSQSSLVQIAGRCARNIDARVIMYADTVTKSMAKAINETARRRKIQLKYNQANNITPKTIEKAIIEGIEAYKKAQELQEKTILNERDDIKFIISELERDMMQAARSLQFEKAAKIRDKIFEYKKKAAL